MLSLILPFSIGCAKKKEREEENSISHTRHIGIHAACVLRPYSAILHIEARCVCMCVHYRAGGEKKREKEEKPIAVLSSPALPELLQAHSPFPHRFTYIRQSQTFLRAQFIAERPPLLHRYKALWCARRIPSFGSNCHN